jgi:predicted aminopeptidase
MRARQPIEALLADPATPADLRQRLALVQEARAFARSLGLEVAGQYTSYVEWPGDRVVTTVVVTRPGEVTPAGWYFPILGRVPYKGFFEREKAKAEAARQRAKGLDVCEVAVSAYSTLGWLDDPVTGPMIRAEEGPTVETILHELVHATVYLRGQADFNEGVASFIGEEGSVRFYAETQRPEAAQRERARIEDWRQVQAATLRLRQRVEELYASKPGGDERDAARSQLERRAWETIAALPLTTRDAREVAESLRLNDACLALTGTYAANLAPYTEKLAALGGDLRTFVMRLREAAESPDPRAALLAP